MGRKNKKKNKNKSEPGPGPLPSSAAAQSEELTFTNEGSKSGIGMMLFGVLWIAASAWSLFISSEAEPTLGSFPIVLAGTLPILIGGFVALSRTISFRRGDRHVRVSRRLVFLRWAESIPYDHFEKLWIWSPKPGNKDAARRHELILTGPYSLLLLRGEARELRALGEKIGSRTGIDFAGVVTPS